MIGLARLSFIIMLGLNFTGNLVNLSLEGLGAGLDEPNSQKKRSN